MIENSSCQTVPAKLSSRAIRLLVHCFHACMNTGNGFASNFCRAKEMHVIRHDYVASDHPPMSIVRTMPFFNQDFCNFF
jgi:hypothetical protein